MMSWNKAPNDRGAALILTLGWSAVLLALAGVVSSAVLQQVRPSDNAESSYQAWAAAEAGVDDARNRLSADSEYWKDIAAFNANPVPTSAVADENRALVTWVPVPGSEEGGPQFTYYLDVSGAAEYGRIQVTSSGRAREGDSIVRTVDVLITKRLSTDYAYLSNSEAFPYDLPGAYGQVEGGSASDSAIPADVARVLCATDRSGEEPTYWYQWRPWPGKPEGGPETWIAETETLNYGAPYRNSGACLHSVVSAGNGNVGGITFDGPVHTNDVWYINKEGLSSINEQVFGGVVTSSCPDEACDPDARWIGSTPRNSSNIGGGINPDTFPTYEVLATYKNQPWNPAYEPVLELPSDQQLRELRSIAASGGCVFTGPTRIRMTTELTADGLPVGKVHITSPNTADPNPGADIKFCGQGFKTESRATQPTVTLDYAEMVDLGFNGVFYVEDSTDADPVTCEVKEGALRSENSNYPWVIPSDEQDGDDLAIVGTGDTFKGLPDQSTVFKTRDLNIQNTVATAYADLAALESAQLSLNRDDVYYVVASEADKSLYPDFLVDDNYLLYRYANQGGGSWNLATLNDVFDEWTDTPEEQCRSGHVYLEAPAEDGGYTGRYTIAADGDIVITDDIYESSASVRAYNGSGGANEPPADWGVPDATSDNQLGLVPDRWLYIYKLAQNKGGKNGDISGAMSDLLLNIAVLAKDKCLALQDYAAQPALGYIKIVGALAQNARCRLVKDNAGYNRGLTIEYDDRYKRLGPPPFMPVLSQEPWQAKVWSETTVRRDFEAKADVEALTTADATSMNGSTLTWSPVPDGGQLLYVRLLTGAGSVTADTDLGKVSYTPSGGADTAVIEFVVKTSEGLTVGQTITYG